MWDTFAISQKLPRVNNHPMAEKSPNLVALIGRRRNVRKTRDFRREQE
jgi:hypothetical protein